MKYILDTNILFDFYERHYLMQYFPSFWSQLIKIFNEVVITKCVMNEINKADDLKKWIDTNYKNDIVNHEDYGNEYRNILQHIKNCGLYKDFKNMDWFNGKIADPWLVAIAKKENLIIITEEKNNPNLNKNQPNKKPKIPDISKDLNITCINKNQFFKEVDLKI